MELTEKGIRAVNMTQFLRLRVLRSIIAILCVLISMLVSLGNVDSALAVVGGTPVPTPMVYPYTSIGHFFASMSYPGYTGLGGAEEHCGATLIAPTWALTAAHCLRWQVGLAGTGRSFSGQYTPDQITLIFGTGELSLRSARSFL